MDLRFWHKLTYKERLESALSRFLLLWDHASHSRDAVGRLNTFEPRRIHRSHQTGIEAGQPGVQPACREQQRNQVQRQGRRALTLA
jgi:hypothetical protein